MIIRAKTFKGWMEANFDYETMRDIARNGASMGFAGLTYYTDTTKLYDKFNSDIWEVAQQMSDEFGNKNVMEFISSLNGCEHVSDDTTFKNLMVWFAAETIAQELTD